MESGMEDAKPSGSRRDVDGGEMEARFDLLVQGFELAGSVGREAMELYRRCKPVMLANVSLLGTGSLEEIERHWSAFVLYCIAKLRTGNGKVEDQRGGLSMSLILKATKLNVVDFFREMPQFLLKCGNVLSSFYGVDWERRLEVKEAQANFVHLRLLSSYYKRAYEEYFLSNSSVGSGKDSCETLCAGYGSEYHRFGWLLFLALRIHAFNRLKDLVSCTNGLVSILAILIIHVPVNYRKFSFASSTHFAKRTNKGISLLASLCDIYQTSEDDLKIAMEKTNSLIIDILKKTPCPASECQAQTLSNFDTDGLTYFEDLVEQGSLHSSLLILENDYDNAVHTKGELDERVFVNEEDSLFGSGSLSGGAINLCGSKRKFDTLSLPCKTITSPLSPPRSPASPAPCKILGNTKVAATPVTTAMTTAKWLRTIIAPHPSKPSADLQHFLSSCNRNVMDEVTHRANIILEAIFPCCSHADQSAGSLHNAPIMDSIWAGERKMEALKLYYRVLEAICRAESHILCGSNLTSLLSNERFHRCMLACSAELVLATHKTVSMMFPAVLERTGITAFDLSKVIETFVRHEETLPRELKRHLNSLEERLLESLTWERGSSMYSSLIVAKPEVAEEINRLSLLPEPMLSLDSIALRHNIALGGSPPRKTNEMLPDLNGDICSPTRVAPNLRSALLERNSFRSPVKDSSLSFGSPKSKMPLLQSAFATPTRLNPGKGGETCAESGISVFFSKIIKLSAIRIKSLCEKLQLQQQILERSYIMVQQIVEQRTHLFFNRHIDQIILCSLYGVAKISQLSLTFKEIINCYRKQPQCKPQVFRSVFVDWPTNIHNGKKGQEYVDIITFYNGVFIPSVKPLLVELGQGRTASKLNCVSDANIFDGRGPGSPRLSQFPSLPDMSPKKVSATHNVYVSPLRSSKMDALLSPSSKSYYACVGESTHAYQSPSKDLTAINNRINSGRKLRLNFDVVSDSLVVGSLSSQNATSVSSSAAVVTSSVKCEQSDV